MSNLVKLSKNAWHFKFMKWTYNKEIQLMNLCPYFWLLILACFISPFVLVGKGFSAIASMFNYFIELNQERKVTKLYANKDKMLNFMTEHALYDYYGHEYRNSSVERLRSSKYDRLYYSSEEFIKWFKTNIPESEELVLKKMSACHGREIKTLDEITDQYIIERAYNQVISEYFQERAREIYRKNITRKLENVRPIITPIEPTKFELYVDNTSYKIGEWFDKAKKVSFSKLAIISKKIFGVIISLALLAGLFFVATVASYGVAYAFHGIVYHIPWTDVLISFGAIILFIGVPTTIIVTLIFYIQKSYEKYQLIGKKTFAYYLLFTLAQLRWPFVGLWWILKIIFYTFLYKLVIYSIYKSFTSFFSIFGEYFGASYGQYCPGIEWEDENNNQNQ